jgi:hypothetical protein
MESDAPPCEAPEADSIAISSKPKAGVRDALSAVHDEARGRAWLEEWEDRRRRIVPDSAREIRRAYALESELAPTVLSPTELAEWREWRAVVPAPGTLLRTGIAAERRLAPEAATFEARMDFVLLKHANVPLGSAGHLVMGQYWHVVDVAAESIEQAAYPGTDDARKRYALALRRCARDLSDIGLSDARAQGHALWRARGTLRLALDDGTLGLWESSQDVIDFVGRNADGSVQDVDRVSDGAWRFVWEYAVVSRLRQVLPARFAGVPDNREYRADELGRLLDDGGRPLAWVWDGLGSGMLNGYAALNVEAAAAFQLAMDETGVTKILAASDVLERHEASAEYREFRRRQNALNRGTTAVACEALADLLDQKLRLGLPRYNAPAVTVQPVHFDDFSGKQFERLVFAYHLRTGKWRSLEWYGQSGGDLGRDIWGETQTGDTLCVQCVNREELKASKANQDLDKVVGAIGGVPIVFRVVCGSKVSSGVREKVKAHARGRGVATCEIWSGPEFEERLRRDAESLLKRFIRGETFPDAPDELQEFLESGTTVTRKKGEIAFNTLRSIRSLRAAVDELRNNLSRRDYDERKLAYIRAREEYCECVKDVEGMWGDDVQAIRRAFDRCVIKFEDSVGVVRRATSTDPPWFGDRNPVREAEAWPVAWGEQNDDFGRELGATVAGWEAFLRPFVC